MMNSNNQEECDTNQAAGDPVAGQAQAAHRAGGDPNLVGDATVLDLTVGDPYL